MKRFTVREFQTDPTKCLKSGQFILTRYNVPVAMVTKLEGITQQVEQSVKPKIQTGVELLNKSDQITQQVTQHPQVVHDENIPDAPLGFGRCQAPGCRNDGYLEASLYKEWNGEMGEWHTRELLMCSQCVAKFERISTDG